MDEVKNMQSGSGAAEKDPVCGMTVDPVRAKATHEHAGKMYYFCCVGCKEKFRAAPAKYLAPKTLIGISSTPVTPLQIVSSTAPAAAASAEKDPVCGMTVDPARAKATHEHAAKTYYFCCAGCKESSLLIRRNI